MPSPILSKGTVRKEKAAYKAQRCRILNPLKGKSNPIPFRFICGFFSSDTPLTLAAQFELRPKHHHNMEAKVSRAVTAKRDAEVSAVAGGWPIMQ